MPSSQRQVREMPGKLPVERQGFDLVADREAAQALIRSRASATVKDPRHPCCVPSQGDPRSPIPCSRKTCSRAPPAASSHSTHPFPDHPLVHVPPQRSSGWPAPAGRDHVEQEAVLADLQIFGRRRASARCAFPLKRQKSLRAPARCARSDRQQVHPIGRIRRVWRAPAAASSVGSQSMRQSPAAAVRPR